MSEILESFTCDYTTIVHHAVRADGAIFTRQRRRGFYGYANTAWRQVQMLPERTRRTGMKARLPKEDVEPKIGEEI